MNIKLKDIIDQKLSKQELNALHSFFRKGGSWQDVFKFTPFEIEEIYKKGYDFYQNGDLKGAKEAFLGLIHLNPYVARNWFSYACVLQAEKDYQEALTAFDFCLGIQNEHVEAYFCSGQCAYALNNIEQAKQFLQKVIALEPHSSLGQKARFLIEALT